MVTIYRSTKMEKKPWLTIIGIGDNGWESLTLEQQRKITQADMIFGGRRHLGFLPTDISAKLQVWPSPFSKGIDNLLEYRHAGVNIVVLASGDPMHFGVGVTLAKRLPIEEMIVLPHPSSFSLAAARLGWALQDVVCLSVLDRSFDKINRCLQKNLRLLVLSENRETPKILAKLLSDQGFGQSRFIVLEHLGGQKERILTSKAYNYNVSDNADLNIVAIECMPDNNNKALSIHSALPDSAFHHDGQLTKQDIRAVTMAHLAPRYGELLWDVGAGCGSISIEWLCGAGNTRAIAIEQNEDRQKLILENARNLGVPQIELVKGKAPDALAGLDNPDAIFIGGGFTKPDVFEICWEKLKSGGRLVANGVTLETSTLLVTQAKKIGARLINVSISEAGVLGGFHVWRPALPVTIMVAKKS